YIIAPDPPVVGGGSSVPNKLDFITQPLFGSPGGVITPAIQVAIRDAYGATITNASVPVTISLATNPTAATLSGTLTRTAVNGIATFNDLSIDKAGTGYRLAASASGLTGATSDPFDVFGVCLGTPVFSPVADPGSNTEPLLARGVQGLSGDANRDLVVLHGNGL